LPLCFERPRPQLFSKASIQRCGAVLARAAAAAALLGAAACSDDEGDGGTAALADSGVVARLTDGEIGIPTTVVVAEGVAWIVESQFDRYEPFGGVGEPAPFRLIGL